MKKSIFTHLILLYCITGVNAQQFSSFENPQYTRILHNPAFAGLPGVSTREFQMGYHHQWIGIENAPKAGFFSFDNIWCRAPSVIGKLTGPQLHAPDKRPPSISIGMYGITESYGVFRKTSAGLPFSFALINHRQFTLAFGVTPGLSVYNNTLYRDIPVPDDYDPVFNQYLTDNADFVFEPVGGLRLCWKSKKDMTFQFGGALLPYTYQFKGQDMAKPGKYWTAISSISYKRLEGGVSVYSETLTHLYNITAFSKFTPPGLIDFAMSLHMFNNDRQPFTSVEIAPAIRLSTDMKIILVYELPLSLTYPTNNGSVDMGISYSINKKK
jgi:hypothetical protein